MTWAVSRGDSLALSPRQDLLKHTPEDHPDHPFLIDAQRNIKQVAERINKGMKSAEEVERNARIVQEIESHIEGMEDVRMGGLRWEPLLASPQNALISALSGSPQAGTLIFSSRSSFPHHHLA